MYLILFERKHSISTPILRTVPSTGTLEVSIAQDNTKGQMGGMPSFCKMRDRLLNERWEIRTMPKPQFSEEVCKEAEN